MKLLETYHLNPLVKEYINIGYHYHRYWIWTYPNKFTEIRGTFEKIENTFLCDYISSGVYRRMAKCS